MDTRDFLTFGQFPKDARQPDHSSPRRLDLPARLASALDESRCRQFQPGFKWSAKVGRPAGRGKLDSALTLDRGKEAERLGSREDVLSRRRASPPPRARGRFAPRSLVLGKTKASPRGYLATGEARKKEHEIGSDCTCPSGSPSQSRRTAGQAESRIGKSQSPSSTRAVTLPKRMSCTGECRTAPAAIRSQLASCAAWTKVS